MRTVHGRVDACAVAWAWGCRCVGVGMGRMRDRSAASALGTRVGTSDVARVGLVPSQERNHKSKWRVIEWTLDAILGVTGDACCGHVRHARSHTGQLNEGDWTGGRWAGWRRVGTLLREMYNMWPALFIALPNHCHNGFVWAHG